MAAFRSTAAGRVGRFVEGDRLICYIVDGIGFVGVLEVDQPLGTSRENPTWGGSTFPIGISVRVLVHLPIDRAIPMKALLSRLPRIDEADRHQAGAWGVSSEGHQNRGRRMRRRSWSTPFKVPPLESTGQPHDKTGWQSQWPPGNYGRRPAGQEVREPFHRVSGVCAASIPIPGRRPCAGGCARREPC